MPKTRMYKVVEAPTEKHGAPKTTLVEATSKEAALSHVTTPRFTIEIAKPMEIVALMKAGIIAETAATE